MAIVTVLKNHTSFETAYEVPNYPYGRLRTSMFYWIESNKKGDRVCSRTINPKTGKLNKVHTGVYSPFKYLYLDEIGHVQNGGVNGYKSEFPEQFKFILESIGEENLQEVQKENLRVNYYMLLRGGAPYVAVKYSDAKKEEFKTWVLDTLKHIRTAPFNQITNHTAAPEQDNPTGEVKFTTTTYTIGGDGIKEGATE